MLGWLDDLLNGLFDFGEPYTGLFDFGEPYTPPAPPTDWTLAQQAQERWSAHQMAGAVNATPYAQAWRYWWPWSEAFWK